MKYIRAQSVTPTGITYLIKDARSNKILHRATGNRFSSKNTDEKVIQRMTYLLRELDMEDQAYLKALRHVVIHQKLL